MRVEDVPVKRRFQLRTNGPVFMRIELAPEMVQPVHADSPGIPVINLDKGIVFLMKPEAYARVG